MTYYVSSGTFKPTHSLTRTQSMQNWCLEKTAQWSYMFPSSHHVR